MGAVIDISDIPALSRATETTRCGQCGEVYSIGDYPFCPHGRGTFSTPNANVHSSERVVIYEDGKGNVSIPGRTDRPIHPKMAAAGYVRRELTTPAEVSQLEKRKGLVHEAGNYNNSGLAEKHTGSV